MRNILPYAGETGKRERLNLQRTMASSPGEESSQIDLNLPSRRACVDNLKNKIARSSLGIAEENINTAASICRVPAHLRDLYAEAYEPKKLCIGPFHRNKSKFLPMEEIKLKCLLDILRGPRSGSDHFPTIECLWNILRGPPGSRLEILVDSVYNRLSEARDYYSEKIELSDDEFAEMLVVDGCFVISVLLAWTPVYPSSICSRAGLSLLMRDIMLLENQLPFFIVEALYTKLATMTHLRCGIIDLVSLVLLSLLGSLPPMAWVDAKDVLHLLHLMYLTVQYLTDVPHYRISLGEMTMSPAKNLMLGLRGLYGSCCSFHDDHETYWTKIRCATELLEEGVKFKRKTTRVQHQRTFDLSISFRDGTLEIPSLHVSDSRLAELRNLVAFEQCYKIPSHFATSYFVFLDQLIESPNDVAVLRKSKILRSEHLSDAEMAEMFSGLSKNLVWDLRFDLHSLVYAALEDFCKLPHRRWRVNLVQNYFSNPWTTLSVMAAILLLFFSGTQTFFTVFPRQ